MIAEATRAFIYFVCLFVCVFIAHFIHFHVLIINFAEVGGASIYYYIYVRLLICYVILAEVRWSSLLFVLHMCSDLGVYIAGMVEGQFAAKSGSLQLMDRILACNGCDFTKRMSSEQVEEVFGKMVHEPLLRMAISRGGLKSTLQKSTELGGADREDVGGASVSGIEGGGVTAAGGGGGGDETGEVVGGAEVLTVGVAKVELSEKVETNESVSRPSIRTVGKEREREGKRERERGRGWRKESEREELRDWLCLWFQFI